MAGNYFDQFDGEDPVIAPTPPSEVRAQRDQELQEQSAARDQRTETRDIGETVFKNSTQLRDQFFKLKQVEDYRASIGAYNSALKTADTPAGDQSLIVSYAKLLDPGSTVREGEFETTANTDREIGKIKARLAKEFGFEGGGLLSSDARNFIRSEIRGLVENRYRPAYDQAREDYTHLRGS